MSDTIKTCKLLNDLVSNGRSKKKNGIGEVRVEMQCYKILLKLLSILIPISAQVVQYWTQKYLIVINHHYPTWGRVESFYASPISGDEVELIIKALHF